ncbi:MAG TPA: hypothetical protein VEB20_26485, partial [Azospirillaceae bacterium]|nr:hypothetical protein [Azospirillaceae bacterium]
MSDTPLTIPAAPPDDPGLSYEALRTEAIRMVQRMSGDIWTDYNYSDPGVTIVEQLCYALTELSYRAGYSVPDIMGDPATGAVALRRAGLYPARTMLPVN